MYCKYLTKRIGYLYCKNKKEETTLSQCKLCPLFERNTTNIVKYTQKDKSVLNGLKTPLKQIGKKREFVSKETYQKVFERDKGQCQLCGSKQNIELHHIIYRSHSKSGINDIDNCILLCKTHHELVHSNAKKYKPLLQEFIKAQKKS